MNVDAPRKWQTGVIAFAGLLAAIVVPLYAYKVHLKQDYMDFDVYYRAALRLKEGLWDQVYNLGDGASPFRYAPPLLPFFRPFAELSHSAARMSWYFLQVIWFAIGFFFIYRAVSSVWIACAAFLFVLRFCLDCFTIGQVSSLLFLGYCASLYFWVSHRPGKAGSALLVPSIFKIGPGFLYSLFALEPRSAARVRAIGAPLLWLAGLVAFLRLWVGDADRFAMLWQGWVQVVVEDSSYFDASHYGSQSIKSAILRAVNWRWLTPDQAHVLYLSSVLLGCLAVIGFWLVRRSSSRLGRGLFFALGVFPYLWFMPETFKYSLTTLAIPVAMLLACPKKDRLTWLALGFGALTLSLAGLDVVGKSAFFAMQTASIPLIATFLLAAACFRQAYWHSSPAPWVGARDRGVAPWKSVPAVDPGLSFSILVSPVANEETLARISRHFESRGESFEVLSAPQGPREVIVRARGKWILALNAEQPCDLEFFDRAIAMLQAGGVSLVRANRRHPESRFRIPVKFLQLVYGRHRLGLLFNRLVRALFPVHTTDTHSGTWAMSREAALKAFALQQSSGFLSDLEISLALEGYGMKEADLPVIFWLAHEKTVSRISREAISILLELPRLVSRHRQGFYRAHAMSQAVTADDWGISPGVNQGILELARAGVVKRTSAMAYGQALSEKLTELQAIPGVRIGLHFDLTFGKSSPSQVLLQWIKPGADRQSLGKQVRDEFTKQLTILREAGIRVDYLDGHHHIHLVPGILDALAPLLKDAGIREVRLPYSSSMWLSKPALALLAWNARRSFKRLGFDYLVCVYPQSGDFVDQGRLRALLGRDPRAEVIVHPAAVDDFAALGVPDSYTSGRVTEFEALRMLASPK